MIFTVQTNIAQVPAGGTALVLGGGGMFGAYEAGVWEVLEGVLRPDLIAGASIGALNGWAIAGCCPAQEWTRQWMNMEMAQLPHLRLPKNPLSGFLDPAPFEKFVRELHGRFTPQVPFCVALTDLLKRKPYSVMAPHVEWSHLAASCAVFGVFPQYRIGGRLTTDGGLLASVPVWAAVERGARRIVAVNLLPRGGPWYLRGARALLRGVSHPPAPHGPEIRLVWIEHARALGTPRDAMRWSRSSAERMIRAGRADAQAALPAIRDLLSGD
jgi:NTE family protein